jgi:hypothetical protein
VDSLEKLTKIDFYPGIPDDFEKTIESNKNISKWDLTGSSSGGYYNNSSNSNNTGNAAKQCTATTQKGTRCKRMTKSPNGKCWQHGGD